jgi:N-acetyl-anhydromuramyl-L-alanine amidase AmpD
MISRLRTNWIVIHCSATRAIQINIGAKDIRLWHHQKGWTDIGYHYVIKRSGAVEKGRELGLVGAGVEGHNTDSVHICLVGGLNDDTWKPENNYTSQQWAALQKLVSTLTKKYPAAKVLGHRDFAGVKKACPCFNVRPWAKKLGFPIY